MNDYEVQVFDRVDPRVAPLCAQGKFVSTNDPTLTAYPAGSLIEIDNSTVRRRQSTSFTEDYSNVMYQLDVYGMTKQSCRTVYKAADEEMIRMGFVRVSGTWLDNSAVPEVSRYTARYEAWIDAKGIIYRPA